MAYKQKGFTPFTQNRFNWHTGPMRGPNPARGQKRKKTWNKLKSGVRNLFTKKYSKRVDDTAGQFDDYCTNCVDNTIMDGKYEKYEQERKQHLNQYYK